MPSPFWVGYFNHEPDGMWLRYEGPFPTLWEAEVYRVQEWNKGRGHFMIQGGERPDDEKRQQLTETALQEIAESLEGNCE